VLCDAWQIKLDTYLDGELPSEEMNAFEAHVRGCPSCAATALARVQMKRAVQAAGKRFVPNADFKKRIKKNIAAKPQRRWLSGWVLAACMAGVVLAAALGSNYLGTRSRDHQVVSEIADLHVTALASAAPVEVISTDRHTVKPWFQGKIPFSFNLPELQNSEFALLGGRMTYLEQTPGAHLIYDVRKHHISVFVFQERAIPSRMDERSLSPKNVAFNIETWSQGGLRYFIIGDASAADVDALAKLFKAAE
jgi:anti-sigma factor RsiW